VEARANFYFLPDQFMAAFEHHVVLLAEDDENDVFLMQTAFPRAGLTNPLQVVRSGEEAIAYLAGSDQFADRQQFPMPLLVLLDLKLPKKNGFEVLDWAAQQPFRRQLVVVILTASSRKEDANRAYALGADLFLTKPRKFDDLVEMTRCLHYWVRLNHFAKLPEHRITVDELYSKVRNEFRSQAYV
jgi:CheY-like chemotaxis protein